MGEIETDNFAMVGVRGAQLVILRPQAVREMDQERALLLAAWLVALVGDEARFAEILQEVKET